MLIPDKERSQCARASGDPQGTHVLPDGRRLPVSGGETVGSRRRPAWAAAPALSFLAGVECSGLACLLGASDKGFALPPGT